MQYKETSGVAEQYKVKYLHGVEKLIGNLEQKAVDKRKAYCCDLIISTIVMIF